MPSKRATAKLANLKRKAEKAVEEKEKAEQNVPGGENNEEFIPSEEGGEATEPSSKRMKFRNYRPHDAQLRQEGNAEKGAEDKSTRGQRTNKTNPADLIKEEMESMESKKEGSATSGVQKKKKPHDDLKAQIEPKLLKLKKSTTRAIVEILRAKLKSENTAS